MMQVEVKQQEQDYRTILESKAKAPPPFRTGRNIGGWAFGGSRQMKAGPLLWAGKQKNPSVICSLLLGQHGNQKDLGR